jgi:[acyl-carrier-protein] S-malonyltransferase
MPGYAVVFPGQASQHPDLLPWLGTEADAAPLLNVLGRLVGADWRRRLHDADWRQRNAIAQPLVVGTSLAAWAVLAPRLPPPTIAAGYSVGELAAVGAAGALDAKVVLDLAVDRARCMDEAAEVRPGGLMAAIGLSAEAVAARCGDLEIAWAIDLGPSQSVQAGTPQGLDEAATRLSAVGAECRRLPIAVASHSPFMASAVAPFARRLATASWRTPRLPLAVNAGGRLVRDAPSLQQALATQLDHRVDWATVEDQLLQRGVRCVLEVGPGRALSRGWQQRQSSPVPARALEDFASAQGAADWVRARLFA